MLVKEIVKLKFKKLNIKLIHLAKDSTFKTQLKINLYI